jgi:hypothetical protein
MIVLACQNRGFIEVEKQCPEKLDMGEFECLDEHV